MIFVMNSTVLINLYHLLLHPPLRVIRAGNMRLLNLLISIEIQIIVLLHIPAIRPELLLLRIFLANIIRIVIHHLHGLVIHHLHFIWHRIQLMLYLRHIIINMMLSFILFLLVIHIINFLKHLLLIRLFEILFLILFFFVKLLE